MLGVGDLGAGVGEIILAAVVVVVVVTGGGSFVIVTRSTVSWPL